VDVGKVKHDAFIGTLKGIRSSEFRDAPEVLLKVEVINLVNG